MADPLAAFADGPFGPLAEEPFARTEQLSGAQVVDLYSTTSAIASLPPSERDELKRKLLPLLHADYRLRITTVLYWAKRG